MQHARKVIGCFSFSLLCSMIYRQMRNGRQNFLLILTLGILNALTPFSIDLYLPAFPEIARDLNTAVARVSLSVSIYFVGFALGQIFYGPLLDRFGRKRPLYLGLFLYLVATLGCMKASSIEMLLLFRFASALGGSAASVGATAMVRDFFPPKDGAKVFSMLMLVLSVSPLLAPSIGSFIITIWGWRSIFGILSAIALLDVALIAFALPSAYSPDPGVSLSLDAVLSGFRKIFANKRFRSYTLAGSLSFAGLFVYVAASPAIYMDGFGLSPKAYGAVFALLAMGMIGGGQLNHVLVKRYGSHQVFKGALFVQMLAGAFLLLGSLVLDFGVTSTMMSTTFLLFVILGCAGITYPNAASLALEPFSTHVGSASALLGFLQLGVGSFVAASVGLLDTKGTLPTAVVIFLSCVLGWLTITLGERSGRKAVVTSS
jgi:DHA1 family bicyclomycin/chloramphenicol resistance-like MFS transporter